MSFRNFTAHKTLNPLYTMKEIQKYFLISLLLTLFSVGIGTASPLATFNKKIFYVPNQGPVLETYIEIAANSVVLKDNGSGILTGKVQLTLIFRQDSTIITFVKKTIISPEMKANALVDFLDVQRFALKPGDYTLEISIKDLGDPAEITESKILDITIPTPPDGIFISDIELVSGIKKTEKPGIYSKSGYDLIPFVKDNRLYPDMKELILYTEIYGTTEGTDGKFLVKAYIENSKNLKAYPTTVKYIRMDAEAVNPVLLRMPLTELPSGNYNIVVEARSPNNVLLAEQKLGVKRLQKVSPKPTVIATKEELANSWVSKYTNKYILFEYIKSLRPIAGQNDRSIIDNTFRDFEKIDLDVMQSYFYSFWEVKAAGNGEQAWLAYKIKVKQADNEFGSQVKRGYETDQGRVYLQYGSPNEIVDRPNEPSAYPYRIWHYYKLNDHNNVKFVFYDPTRIGKDYQLLHSENIPGEISNYRWKLLLESPSFPQNDLNRTNTFDQYGRQVDDLFNNPR